MWIARWLAAAVVGLVGILCVAIATWTLVSRDWHPTRELRPDDSARISAAVAFVEISAMSLGRMPTAQEFDKIALAHGARALTAAEKRNLPAIAGSRAH